MSTFDDRQKSFESKFAYDEEIQFKVFARRNKLLGLWIAEKLGKTGDDAARYATEVVTADLDEPGDQDVIRKVLADCKEGGVVMDEETLKIELERLLPIAKNQIAEQVAK